jgi:hypothetical protein
MRSVAETSENISVPTDLVRKWEAGIGSELGGAATQIGMPRMPIWWWSGWRRWIWARPVWRRVCRCRTRSGPVGGCRSCAATPRPPRNCWRWRAGCGTGTGTVNLRSCGGSPNHISLIRHTRPGESRRRNGENRPRIAQVDSALRRHCTCRHFRPARRRARSSSPAYTAYCNWAALYIQPAGVRVRGRN